MSSSSSEAAATTIRNNHQSSCSNDCERQGKTKQHSKRSESLALPSLQETHAASTAAETSQNATNHISSNLFEKHSSPIQFSVNDECTSLALTPSGNFVLGGFTDGTLRVFDLTERFATGQWKQSIKSKKEKKLTHSSSGADADTITANSYNSNSSSSGMYVCSHNNQQYGAVAGQILSRGVHTSLRMQVSVSPDGLFCFAGVTRGSMELLIVDLGQLEQAVNVTVATGAGLNGNARSLLDANASPTENLLDYLSVYRHTDAKLRGFGACTKLQNPASPSTYLLLCGKGIKNIHIWSFEPPIDSSSEPTFELIYNCVTNGNSINLLDFRHVGPDRLFALSKSQQQKLRVWDLSHEEKQVDEENKATTRPIRPPFTDVANTEATLGVAGGFCLCGGSDYHFNQMSIVSLEDVASDFNHTEIALPGIVAQASSSRRQQRGDLKSVEAVAGMSMDGGHALLELNDRTLVHYTHHGGRPMLKIVLESDLPEGWSRTLSIGRIGSDARAVAAVASHNPFTGRGSISLWPMENVSGRDKPRMDLNCAGMQAVPKLDSLLKPRATKPSAFPTVKGEYPFSFLDDDEDEELMTMRELTNKDSVSKLTGTRTLARVSLDGTEAIPRRSPPNYPGMSGIHVSPELPQRFKRREDAATTSDVAATQALLVSAKLLKKIKRKELRKQRLDEALNTVCPSTKFNCEEGRKSRDPDRPPLAVEKPRKKVKRATPVPSIHNSPLAPPSAHTALKPAPLELAKLSLSPVANRRQKETTVSTPVLSPKQQRQSRSEDLQDVIRDKCTEQQEKLLVRLSEFPSTSVHVRLGLGNKSNDIVADSRERERTLLSAEHLAAHERAAKAVLRAAYDILESVQRSPFLQSLESGRELLRVTLLKFRASVESQLVYQHLQAQELAARQTWQHGQDTTCVEVNFPFFQVFDQASESLPQLIR
ncbi:hypothetical protein MPSEU_000533900 [Mayamaea pseudoterrestris]|nr:hypothetical protein MPSEU_000533900 [Mayamaea pseudoterrestris]